MSRLWPDRVLRRGLKAVHRRLGHVPRREDFLLGLPRHAVAAEIGVFRGEFTKAILTTNRPRELHLIDGWWELYGERFPMWGGAYTNLGQLTTRQAYEEVVQVVKRFERDTRTSIHVGDDCTILATFPDDYFDWVYLDTSHQYDHTLAELRILSRKVKPEGVISGDDWQDNPKHKHHGASVAIKEFCQEEQWQVDERDTFHQWRISRRPSR